LLRRQGRTDFGVPRSGNDSSTFKIDSIKTFHLSGNASELDVNGKKTSFSFPGTHTKDVEVQLLLVFNPSLAWCPDAKRSFATSVPKRDLGTTGNAI
jgi:hypothetical protein